MLSFLEFNEQEKPTVVVHGKIRIPTIGHKNLVDTAKNMAKKMRGKVHINLSGADKPLSNDEKKKFASHLFNHEVHGDAHTSSFVGLMKHLSDNGHHHVHILAGSDRADEYKKVLDRYNGKPDKKGNIPFHFKSWKVHTVGAERGDVDKHPTKMSSEELSKSVSATKIEKHARDGDYNAVKAYYPGVEEKHVKSLYNKIRAN